jgi:acetyl-CoA C-acetyltransferase
MPCVASIGKAGMTPADIDVTEVHDFFTDVDLIGYEGQGFVAGFGATILEGPVAHGR